MTRRFQALMDGGFPYFVAGVEGRVVGYAYAGPTAPAGLPLHGGEFDLLHPSIHRRGIGTNCWSG